MNRGLLKRHVWRLLGLLGAWAVYCQMGLPCPVTVLTGLFCPACGSTRAVFALLRGDWRQYFYYQPLAVPLMLAVLLCMHLSVMEKAAKKIAWVLIGGVLLSNTVLYIFRLARYLKA